MVVFNGQVDPVNMGSVLRSSLFFNVSGVVTTMRQSAPLSPSVSKASAGALEVMDIFNTHNMRLFLEARLLGC